MDFSSLTVFSCFLTPGQLFISPAQRWAPLVPRAPRACGQAVRWGTRPWQSISTDMGCGSGTVTGGTCRDRGQQAQGFNHGISDAEQQRSWHEWV